MAMTLNVHGWGEPRNVRIESNHAGYVRRPFVESFDSFASLNGELASFRIVSCALAMARSNGRRPHAGRSRPSTRGGTA